MRKPFKTGDKVLTDYDPEIKGLVRIVSRCWQDKCCSSGWLVTLRASGQCPHCGRVAPAIEEIDSNWCRKHQPKEARP